MKGLWFSIWFMTYSIVCTLQAQVVELELAEGEGFHVKRGFETEYGYHVTARLIKNSCSPIYFVGEQSIDFERSEMQTRPVRVFMAAYSQAQDEWKVILNPVKSGSVGRERFILVSKTRAGFDDLYDLYIYNNHIAEVIRAIGASKDSVVRVRMGFEIYEELPKAFHSEKLERFLFTEPIHFAVDDEGAIKLLGCEALGTFYPKVGSRFGLDTSLAQERD